MNPLKASAILTVSILTASLGFSAVTLVQTSDPGFYNNSIGTLLNSTNGGEAGPFPVSNDSTLSFPSAPDLSAASVPLGNWLTNPLSLNANWQSLASVPNSWTPGTEVAVIYQFNTLGATNVIGSFGVDNGIYAWLDGVYLGGARAAGGVLLGEHVFNIGNLSSGTHFLQLLLEDHGSANGYAVQITADTFIPGPPPGSNSVPDSGSTALLLGSTLVGFAALRRKLLAS